MDDLEDPQVLPGEPLAVDLLNTVWAEGGTLVDQLETLAGVDAWVRAEGLATAAADQHEQRSALRATREAIRRVLDSPGRPEAVEALNAVLARGRRVRLLGEPGAGPAIVERVEVDSPAYVAAWTAADDFLQLLELGAHRIRTCAHPSCVLTYFDRSRTGRRMWCSMADCGNRAKAARHYARSKSTHA